MSSKKTGPPAGLTTEQKIKMAARTVFHQKGFAATRTRDIAKEANIQLALLNYHFTSKEKLFELIMLETLTQFFQGMGAVFNDETTSLGTKVQLVAEKYIDLILAEPEIPLFIMSEVRSHGAEILKKLPVAGTVLQSVFIKQYKEAAKKNKLTEPNPLHFLMNLLGLIVFPFVNGAMIKKVGNLPDAQFEKLMNDRKKLIPIWMKAMFKIE
jgi:AcrR family transcriptional regulator